MLHAFSFGLWPHEAISSGLNEFWGRITRSAFFGAQKEASKAKYQPLLWGIFHDIYKLVWPDPIFHGDLYS